jgi:hypothetical protein
MWTLMDENEYKNIWDKIYKDFYFKTDININKKTFCFNIPFDIYA